MQVATVACGDHVRTAECPPGTGPIVTTVTVGGVTAPEETSETSEATTIYTRVQSSPMQPVGSFLAPTGISMESSSTYMEPSSSYMEPSSNYMEPVSTYVQLPSPFLPPLQPSQTVGTMGGSGDGGDRGGGGLTKEGVSGMTIALFVFAISVGAIV